MKQSLNKIIIICLILGLIFTAVGILTGIYSDDAARLRDSADIEARLESQKKTAELLGIDIDMIPLDDTVELTVFQQIYIFLGEINRVFLIIGIDLLTVGAYMLVSNYLKHNKKTVFGLGTKGKKSSATNITGILLAFGVLFLDLTIATDSFLTTSNLLNNLQQITVNFILAMGMSFALISGGIDLSVGSNVAFIGLLSGVLMITREVNVGFSLIICLLTAVAVGVINGLLIAKMKLPPFIATLGMMMVLRGLAYSITGGSSVSKFPASFVAISGRIGNIPVWGTVIILIVLFCAWYILKYTPFGRYVYAIGGNEKCAELSGINVSKVKMFIYIISGFCAGLAGILYTSRLNSITPTSADGYEMDAIASVIIGGTSMSGGSGSIIGTVIGVMIIQCISNGLNLLGVAQGPQKVVKGVIIVVAVIVDIMRRRSDKAEA